VISKFEMVAELQIRSQMTKINYFVTTVIGYGILERLAGDSTVILLGVLGVTQVEEPSPWPIIFP